MASYPDRIDNVTARLTAAQISLWALASVWFWPLLVLVAADLALRAVAGPSRAPLSRVAIIARRRLGTAPRWTPAAPKRFAAAMGATMATVAVVAHLAGHTQPGRVLAVTLASFAFAEAALSWCVGCVIYRNLAKVGVIREPDCERCVDGPTGTAPAPRTAARHTAS